MTTVRAYRVDQLDGRVCGRLQDVPLADIGSGEVLIRAEYSSVNYKDALAATGAGKILRSFPLIAGIDVAGSVLASSDPRFAAGDAVLVTGYGLGTDHDGGFAEAVRCPADWVVPRPAGLDARTAMCLGTAGFTAALAITRMQACGQRPELGPVVVTGASGGVGSLAVDLLAGLGYQVVAVSGKADAADYLRSLGAQRVLPPEAVHPGQRPLEKAVWGGAIDNVGGELLAGLMRSVNLWGNIACIGLAGGSELHTTVMPMILRGVSLLGVSSANCAQPLRGQIWQRLCGDLRPRHLDRIIGGECTLDTLPDVFAALLERRITGRRVVRIADPASQG